MVALKDRYNDIEDKILEYVQGMTAWTASNSRKGLRGDISNYPYLIIAEDPIDSPPADLGGHDAVIMQFTVIIISHSDVLTGSSGIEKTSRDLMFDVYEELKQYRSLDNLCEEFYCIRMLPEYAVHFAEGITMAGSALIYIARKRL